MNSSARSDEAREVSFCLQGRRFRPVQNSEHGTVSAQTEFDFSQRGVTVSATYAGGAIEWGQIVGHFVAEEALEILYQCRTTEGALQAGRASVQMSRASEGLRLTMQWQWLTGDRSAGTSEYVEIC
jgi:hypothetical protein